MAHRAAASARRDHLRVPVRLTSCNAWETPVCSTGRALVDFRTLLAGQIASK